MTKTSRTEYASRVGFQALAARLSGEHIGIRGAGPAAPIAGLSVAYSACGNLALSEDVAQETFWTAWRQRASLEQPDRLGAWLCGIARNLRRTPAQGVAAGRIRRTQDVLTELSTDEPDPAEDAVSQRRRRSSGRRSNESPRRIASR